MGKIKKLLMSALACVGVLGCAAIVGSKVEAASYQLGSYKVSTTTNANDKAVWDFTGNTTGKTLSTGDDVLGIICDTTNGTIKMASGYFDPISNADDTTKSGAEFYIPVPAGSAGKVTMEANGDNSTRLAYLNNDSNRKIQNITAANVTKNPGKYDVTEDYTATDISTDPTVGGKKYEGTYLRFVVYSTKDKKKEFKTNRIIVELSNGSFEATAKLVNVTYMDGSTALKVEEVESGKTSSYSPKKWGYDLEGIYTDKELTAKFDSSTVLTEDKVLYTKWTAWDSSVFADPNTLDLNLMAKGYEIFGPALTKTDTPLTGTNYGLLVGNTTYEPRSETVGDFGKATAVIKTGGAMSEGNMKNGISFNASGAGTLTAYILSSTSGTPYALDCYDDKGLVTSSEKVGGTTVDKVQINIPSEGKYYLGAAGSIKFYYVSFEEAAPVVETVKLNYQFDNEVEKNAVRFIGTINAEDLAKLSDIKLDLTLSDGVKSETVTVAFDTVYTSITDLDGFGEAEGVYYIVLELTDLSFARGYTLNATLKVTIDGVEETATLAEAISLAIAK